MSLHSLERRSCQRTTGELIPSLLLSFPIFSQAQGSSPTNTHLSIHLLRADIFFLLLGQQLPTTLPVRSLLSFCFVSRRSSLTFLSSFHFAEAAVRHLGASMAVELATKNVRVNCISPGVSFKSRPTVLDELELTSSLLPPFSPYLPSSTPFNLFSNLVHPHVSHQDHPRQGSRSQG